MSPAIALLSLQLLGGSPEPLPDLLLLYIGDAASPSLSVARHEPEGFCSGLRMLRASDEDVHPSNGIITVMWSGQDDELVCPPIKAPYWRRLLWIEPEDLSPNVMRRYRAKKKAER